MPGQPGRLRMAARAGVIVERVLRALIDLDLVLDGRTHKRAFEGRDAGIDPLVAAGIVQQHRRLNLGHILGIGLRAIVGNRGVQVRHDANSQDQGQPFGIPITFTCRLNSRAAERLK